MSAENLRVPNLVCGWWRFNAPNTTPGARSDHLEFEQIGVAALPCPGFEVSFELLHRWEYDVIR